MNPKPNIIFFFTDDQRFDTIATLGNREIITPNIDRLVTRGTTFTHAHIPSGTSGAVCLPSRAMLNTGRTLFHLTDGGGTIAPTHTTLGQALREYGYQTFGTGKWHNGKEAFARSFSDGDEIFFGGMADHWNVPAYHYDASGQYTKFCRKISNPFYTKKVDHIDCDHITAGKHSTELIRDAAKTFLTRCDAEVPYYMYLSFLAPHDPRSMPEKYLAMYDPEMLTLPPNFMAEHPFDNGELIIRDEQLAPSPRTPSDTRQHLAEYYAMITHVDDVIGDVMKQVEQRGDLDNTIVVFAGDNGLALGQHGLFGKQSCYDHSIRVPLIFAGPGIPEDKRTDAFAYLLDIFPTLCDLTGCVIPTSVEGQSVVPAIQNPDNKGRNTLYFAYTGKHRAVRDRTHKLIEYVVEGKHTMTQLFDMINDPWELNNLADSPEHAAKLSELRTELLRLRDEWDDNAENTHSRTFWDHCPLQERS